MCGICGVVEVGAPVEVDLLVRMNRALEHRGPDAEGFLLADIEGRAAHAATSGPGQQYVSPPPLDPRMHLGFGFRRLAILDTSTRGNQPMSDASGRHWIVFNGEIYNYIELRSELEGLGHSFRTGTDTEVLLAAYAAWGPAFTRRLNGMWAFAIWDMDRAQLVMSRDRFGIKPLYFTKTERGLRFASEIKALLEDPGVRRRPCTPRVLDFLISGRVNHTTQTLFEGVHQLAPATIATWDLRDILRGPDVRTYWALDPDGAALSLGDDASAVQTRDLFVDAIRMHLRSDVPIGTCLSGGIDSSSIVGVVNALLRDEGLSSEQLGERQRTFSSCFEDLRFDERRFSSAVIARTGAEENLVFPNGDDLIRELPQLIWHQDEPFGSTSIYAQWCVFRRAAERGVKVVLDGQGGDELFAGYQGYDRFLFLSLLQHGRFIRGFREGHAASSDDLVASARWFAATASSVWGKGIRTTIRRVLGRATPPSSMTWFNDDAVDEHYVADSWKERYFSDVFQERLYRELHTGLPGLLRYEDRDSMAFSVEARVPFLDHRLVEFAFALRPDQKIRNGVTKHVLREAMSTYLPDEVRGRQDKMGFVTPESTWFRSALGSRARVALDDPPPSVSGLIDVEQLRALAERSEREDLPPFEQTVLWRVLNSCEWVERFGLS